MNLFHYFEKNPVELIIYYNKPHLYDIPRTGIDILAILLHLPFFPHIKELDLSYHYLQGIPQQIYQLKHLEKLYIWRNEIECLDAEIGSLRNLEVLSIGQTKNLFLPTTFGKLQKLKRLVICNSN